MAWGHVLPFAAAAGRFAWHNRYGILRAIDTIQRGRYNRRRSRRYYQAAYLRGYQRGRGLNRTTGRYAGTRYRHGNYARSQYYARRREM